MLNNISRTQNTKIIKFIGLTLFIGMMTVGYYYNLTFIQLGLVDLGERSLGMSKTIVAGQMAILAMITCAVALISGIWMSRRNLDFRTKLRIAFMVILIQTILTYLSQLISSPRAYTSWIIACSIALGMGVPVTFGMTVDLVPVRWRGRVAAFITAGAYLAATLIPGSWTIEEFTTPLLRVMPFGVMALGLLAFVPQPLTSALAGQHLQPAFGKGRYINAVKYRLRSLIIIMFLVFFVDSLGFLRLIDAPRFMEGAWQSASIAPRLFIGLTHALTALVAGVLYDALDVRELFFWIFGIFALTHSLYTFSIRLATTNAPLAMPMLYATAVSLYTVVNFALWADLSTPKTIGKNAALGVAVSGWTATFISTALAIWWQTGGMPLERHLNIVDALAMLVLLALIFQVLVPPGWISKLRKSS